MTPIHKTSTAGEPGVSSHITDPLLVKRLKEQNLWEVLGTLPGEYTKEDILDYLKLKHEQLVDLYQSEPNMSLEAGQPDFSPRYASDINPDHSLSEQELLMFADLFLQYQNQKSAEESKSEAATTKSAAGSGKYAVAPKSSSDGGRPPTGDEHLGNAGSMTDEAYGLLAEMENKIFEGQLHQQLVSKNEELKREFQKILSMVREGKIDAIYIIMALAKVKMAKNGLIFTQEGKRMMRLNQESEEVMKDLMSEDQIDPRILQVTQQDQREIMTQQQFITGNMQKIMQNVESTLSFAKTSIDDIFRTRLQIINAPFKSL